MPGYLYALDIGGGVVKIGTTKCPSRRLSEYKSKGHKIARMFFTDRYVVDQRDGENKIKEMLKIYLHKGAEYFKCDFELAARAVQTVYGQLELSVKTEDFYKTFKINVTGLTESQHGFVKDQAEAKGLNKAAIVKILINDAMEKEGK